MADSKDKNLKAGQLKKPKSAKPSQPNEEENRVIRFQAYIEKNSKKVIIVSIAFIAATILFFIIKDAIQSNAEENKQMATVAIDRILPYYQSSDFQHALYGDSVKTVRGQKIIGLIAIVEQYGSTDQGKIAALYVGNSFLNLDNPQKAIEYFETALDSPSELIIMGANAGLGAANEKLNKFGEAAGYYQKASELADADGAKSRYLYYTGLCFEKSNNTPKAEQAFRQVLEIAQYTEFAKYAKIGLVRIGTIIE